MGLGSGWERAQKCVGKTETSGVASDQTKLSGPTILNVSISIEKYSLTSYLLRVATSCFIL